MKVLLVNQWAEGSKPHEITESIQKLAPDTLIYYGASEARTPEHLYSLPEKEKKLVNSLYKEIFNRGIKVYYITGGEIFLPYYGDKSTFVGGLPNCTIVSNPMYFLRQTYETLVSQGGKELELLNTSKPVYEYNRLYVSLNNLAHTHRQILMDCLTKNHALNHGHISWLNRGNYDCNFKHYNGEIRILDDPFKEHMNNMWRPPYHYFKTPVNIVSESDDFIPFYTEKTWLTIAFSKLFIIQGAVGINSGLVNYGFKIFDNIIDYSFDFITDIERRTDALTKEVKKLEKFSYNQIAQLTEDVREHNRKRLIEIAQNRLYEPSMIKWINDLPLSSFVTEKPIFNF
jgi:hypothetical protein